MRAGFICAVLVCGSTALAQREAEPPEVEGYSARGRAAAETHPGYPGVLPGMTQPPPAYRRIGRGRRRRSVVLTWPGFRIGEDGRARYFVQLTGSVEPELRVAGDRVVVRFPRTTTHLTNSRRWLDTRFFATPVVRARLRREGRGRRAGLVFELRLRPGVRVAPELHREAAPGGEFHYVYVDFPAAGHVPPDANPHHDHGAHGSPNPDAHAAPHPASATGSAHLEHEVPPPVHLGE